MFRCFATAFFAAGALGMLGATAVYNNTANPTGQMNTLLASGEVNGPEHGNQINLASYERIVTNFSMRMRIRGGGAANFKIRIRFYRNDGAGGAPGTMLWDSGQQFGVIDSGADLTYSFNDPNIRVPNSFTWSVQLTDRQIYLAAPMGPVEYNPPTVGSAPFGFWRNSGMATPDWHFVNPNEPPFAAKVDANPIPGDVNHDAQVNIDDLLEVINHWGMCPNCMLIVCPADVNGDCVVNIDDLLAVIQNWG